jgi:hypothetical protein
MGIFVRKDRDSFERVWPYSLVRDPQNFSKNSLKTCAFSQFQESVRPFPSVVDPETVG